MSALNVIVMRDAIHVLTDGLGYGADGTISHVVQKVAINAAIPAVLSARGSLLLLPMLAEHANLTFQTFDSLAAGIGLVMRQACEEYGLAARCEVPEMELAFAGRSEASDEMQAYTIRNHGPQAWERLAIVGALISPCDDELAGTLNLSEAFDAALDGLRILESQRRPFLRCEGGGTFTAVGGFAQLTTLTREGITTRILRRWPDEVGKKIAA